MNTKNIKSLISFKKVSQRYQEIIFQWLTEPHMQEFWDNSPEHKEDILIFINGRVTPSNYFNGIFTYWVGMIDNDPFCFILTAEVDKNEDYPRIWLDNISKEGTTYSIDFGIGNTKYLGKGLASLTLKMFAKFFHEKIEPSADTFFIDPSEHNPRARHVYEKAGFKMVGNFEMDTGVFKGEQTHLMVKRLLPSPKIIPATIIDYPIIENMWHFYIYDMGRYCGLNEGWEDPINLSFIPDDLTNYFVDEDRKAFLVKVGNELAGFVLLNKKGRLSDTQWNMGEFFIIAQYQNKGIGEQVVHQIWSMYQGLWEVSVIPENTSALAFWRKAISKFTDGQYLEEVKIVDCRDQKASRYILSFNTSKSEN